MIATLIRHEGERLKPYLDSVNKLTLGVGRNLTDVGISRVESRFLLENDVTRVEGDLDRYLPWWRALDDVRQRVLAEAAFQLGIWGLMQFRGMLGYLQHRDYSAAAAAMRDSLWAKQTPQRVHEMSTMLETGEG